MLRRALDTFKAPLFQLYGMMETTGAIVQLDPEDHDPEGPRSHLMRSAGRPYAWVEIKIVEPGGDAERATGEVGEVLTRSPQNTPGYWNGPGGDGAAPGGGRLAPHGRRRGRAERGRGARLARAAGRFQAAPLGRLRGRPAPPPQRQDP
ncbi:AMP-binding protein [Actinomadura madurae]|uniref:AMP-binding protein n=1 Tax=Actinomadura madurae TaxID=1993 RepID=UPI003D6B4337